ncbi:hypothetical protein ACFLVI_00120 [Chloroflexota bacterium]
MPFTNRSIVSTPKFVIFTIGFIMMVTVLIIDDDGFIFIIDNANLLFHEAGHLIFRVFGDAMALYGGTLGQLIIPIICIVAFWRQRSLVSVLVVLVWLFENLFNIAGYVADARAQELPLVGGGEHDWANILSRWGALHYDMMLATILRVIGWIGLFSTLICIIYLWWQSRKIYKRY